MVELKNMATDKIIYVGKKVYSIEEYTSEAKRIGVSRILPQRIIRNISFGDRVHLASWDYKETKETEHGLSRLGDATIFGYFTVTGINTDSKIIEAIMPNLKVIDTIDMAGQPVERECGTYELGVCHIVTDTLQEIMDLIHEINPKAKCFITGQFTELKENIIMSQMRFSRSILKTEIKIPKRDSKGRFLPKTSETIDDSAVTGINNYSPKYRYKKGEKESRDNNRKITEFTK